MFSYKYRFDNLSLFCDLPTAGKYNIPILKSANISNCEFIGFNYAMSSKEFDKGIHFFLDDYQFTRVWNNPEKYLPVLRRFSCVMTPDFSLYSDFPAAMQIYNHYRKHALGAYWQEQGLSVIPTICWSDKSSFEWCFDGEPKHSTAAVSSVGTQNSKDSKQAFLLGYEKMLEILEPETIIFYGSIPKECRENIVKINPFQNRLKNIDKEF